MIDNLMYAIEKTHEVFEVVWNLPFFWIPNFTFGQAIVSVVIIWLLLTLYQGIFR